MEPGDRDGDHTDDPASELAALVAAFSAALARHARAGAWAASAAATPRPLGEGPERRAVAAAGAAEVAGTPVVPAAPRTPGADAPPAERVVAERPAQAAPTGARPGAGAAWGGAVTAVTSVTSGSGPLDDSLARFEEVPLPAEDSMPVEDDVGFEPRGFEPRVGSAARAERPQAARASAARAASVQPAPVEETLVFSRGRKTLAMVREELGDCQRCKLARTRSKLVFGSGAEDAALVFIGEAPGAEEDRTGEPFVGRAGELLDKMIEAMGWSRRSVYVANLLKCRPPQNRNPEPDEARECRPFLIAQLEVIAPRIIVALGRPSANALLGTDAPISTLRGKFHERWGLRIMPTFHPAYLLREPARKREAWADLKLVMQELERIGVPPRP